MSSSYSLSTDELEPLAPSPPSPHMGPGGHFLYGYSKTEIRDGHKPEKWYESSRHPPGMELTIPPWAHVEHSKGSPNPPVLLHEKLAARRTAVGNLDGWLYNPYWGVRPPHRPSPHVEHDSTSQCQHLSHGKSSIRLREPRKWQQWKRRNQPRKRLHQSQHNILQRHSGNFAESPSGTTRTPPCKMGWPNDENNMLQVDENMVHESSDETNWDENGVAANISDSEFRRLLRNFTNAYN